MKECNIRDSISYFASALSKCNENSSRKISIEGGGYEWQGIDELDDKSVAAFAETLSKHRNLEVLLLSKFGVGRKSCDALAKLLSIDLIRD